MLETLAGITRGPRPTHSLQRGQSFVSKLARIGFQGERDAITQVESEVVARDPDQGFLEEQLTRTTFPVGSRSNRQIDLSRVERFHQGNAHVDHHSSFTLGYVFANWHKSSGSAVRDEVLGDTQMQSPIQWGRAATRRNPSS